MNVSDTASREKESTDMTTFTIDTNNNISAFATQPEAAAAITTAHELFTTQKELAQLAAAWPAERLIAIYNSLPGAEPVKKFRTAAAGAAKIWKNIQGLGEAAKAVADPAKPKANKKAKGGAPAAQGAPAKGKASRRRPLPRRRPKPRKRPRAQRSPRGYGAPPRRPRWSRCCNARTAPRFPRLWKKWVGRSTPYAGLWRAR
jgi:hypothetical protein